MNAFNGALRVATLVCHDFCKKPRATRQCLACTCGVAGSVGFKDALSGNQHWFEGTQLVVISNTQWVGETMPCLTYGMRGMIALSIEVSLLSTPDVLCSTYPVLVQALLSVTMQTH